MLYLCLVGEIRFVMCYIFPFQSSVLSLYSYFPDANIACRFHLNLRCRNDGRSVCFFKVFVRYKRQLYSLGR